MKAVRIHQAYATLRGQAVPVAKNLFRFDRDVIHMTQAELDELVQEGIKLELVKDEDSDEEDSRRSKNI